MKKEIYVLLNNVRSLYNVGAIFRTAEAADVKKIYLTGISGVEKFGQVAKLHPKVSKTALEGIKIPWEYQEDPIDLIKRLKENSVQIVSLELTEASVPYNKADYKFPLCLVVGHETRGVDGEINNLADLVVQIPMLGEGKSLNVSVATAVALYHLREIIS